MTALNQKVSDALNQQINNELQASYAYLAMAAHFDGEGLSGFASWFRAHSREENDHAMKIYDFVTRRDGKVELAGIEKPTASYTSPETVLEAALAMEKVVTSQIHALFELASQEKEHGTQNMLHWFLEEQISEEDLFRRILDQVKAAGDSRWHLLVLDGQLAGRTETASAAE